MEHFLPSDRLELTILKKTSKISLVIKNLLIWKIVSHKNLLFSKITSFRWQEENNRLPFSLIGIDDHQGLEIKVWVYFFLLHMLSFSKTEIENRKRFFKGLGWCILWLSCQNEKWVPGGRNWLGCWRWRCWCRATNLSVWFMQEKIGFWFSHHVSKYNLYVVSKEFKSFFDG